MLRKEIGLRVKNIRLNMNMSKIRSRRWCRNEIDINWRWKEGTR